MAHAVLPPRQAEDVVAAFASVFPYASFNSMQSELLDVICIDGKNLVVSAPTGSGKTVLFELAITKLLYDEKGKSQKGWVKKAVYVSPLKALCSEKVHEWIDKFGRLGIKCIEITGDSDIDIYNDQFKTAQIVVTTPEKFDAITRTWRDQRDFASSISLVLIDEVHLLNTNRGSTLEAREVFSCTFIRRLITILRLVVSRLNIIKSTLHTSIRFLAVSATIRNIEDIAQWLAAEYYTFGEEHRPVPLSYHVHSYFMGKNEFLFDKMLNKELHHVIAHYAEGKPTLVFCPSRKGCQEACTEIINAGQTFDSILIDSPEQKASLERAGSNVKDKGLRDAIVHGVAYHHANVTPEDRKVVEALFLEGHLKVVCCTSTLSQGVNLPARLCIIKGTQLYSNGKYVEMSEMEVLQMAGRAGRPDFDDKGVAVILTSKNMENHYHNIVSGTQVVESTMLENLVECLNAEIALRSITDVSLALQWLKSTFLFTRVTSNPANYPSLKIRKGAIGEEVEKSIKAYVVKCLNELSDARLIEYDEMGFVVTATEGGRICSRYCIRFETMKLFNNLNKSVQEEDILYLLSDAAENKNVVLRRNEKKILNQLNGKVRYKVKTENPKSLVQKPCEKINILIQASLSSSPDVSIDDYSMRQDANNAIKEGSRILKALSRYLEAPQYRTHTTAKAVANLSRAFKHRMWERDGPLLRQLDGVGDKLVAALTKGGVRSFQDVLSTHPSRLQSLANRNPPFGTHLQQQVLSLGSNPSADLSLYPTGMPGQYEVVITLMPNTNYSMSNNQINPSGQSQKYHIFVNHLNSNVFRKTVPWRHESTGETHKFLLDCNTLSCPTENAETPLADSLDMTVMNENYFGFDVKTSVQVPELIELVSRAARDLQSKALKPESKPKAPKSKNAAKKSQQSTTAIASLPPTPIRTNLHTKEGPPTPVALIPMPMRTKLKKEETPTPSMAPPIGMNNVLGRRAPSVAPPIGMTHALRREASSMAPPIGMKTILDREAPSIEARNISGNEGPSTPSTAPSVPTRPKPMPRKESNSMLASSAWSSDSQAWTSTLDKFSYGSQLQEKSRVSPFRSGAITPKRVPSSQGPGYTQPPQKVMKLEPNDQQAVHVQDRPPLVSNPNRKRTMPPMPKIWNPQATASAPIASQRKSNQDSDDDPFASFFSAPIM